MLEVPYKKGDRVTLQQQYEILSLVSETEECWMFDAIQMATTRKVMIKVYIKESFPSIVEAETAWSDEVARLQAQAESPDRYFEYIESGVLTVSGEKQFIIVCGYVSGFVQPSVATMEETSELKAERSFPPSSEETFEEVSETVVEDVSIRKRARRSETELEEIGDFEETEKVLASSTPSPAVSPPSPAPETESTESISLPPPTSTLSERVRDRFSFSRRKGKRKASIPEESFEEAAVTTEEEKDYLKHISMEYFDRMNPQNYYPFTLSISDIAEAAIGAVVNPITGERKVQKQTEIEVTLKDPIVTIRPTIPGCTVVPNQIDTDFDQEKDEVTFYITPGVKGDIIGQIEFINEGKVIDVKPFEAKVVDPRYARLIAFYGILASFIPKIVTFLGVNLGLNATLNTLLEVSEETFGSINIASLIAIIGIVPAIAVSLVVRRKLRPRASRIQYRITDFRLKNLKLKKTP